MYKNKRCWNQSSVCFCCTSSGLILDLKRSDGSFPQASCNWVWSKVEKPSVTYFSLKWGVGARGLKWRRERVLIRSLALIWVYKTARGSCVGRIFVVSVKLKQAQNSDRIHTILTLWIVTLSTASWRTREPWRVGTRFDSSRDSGFRTAPEKN